MAPIFVIEGILIYGVRGWVNYEPRRPWTDVGLTHPCAAASVIGGYDSAVQSLLCLKRAGTEAYFTPKY